ncbi:MAG: twin-arginine translocase TatA/TatE family subunit [Bdellovibrionaceae bacterium]|nr:twin-arginine translocase TatA/TatE family subunit [Pseudobdellovibrionaceae bacterium]
MGEFSISHMLILAVILLVFFGPSKIPQFGQSLGKAIRGFKQGLNEIDTDSKDVTNHQLNPNHQNVGNTNQPDKAKDPNKA